MSTTLNQGHYDAIARYLHWISAALFVTALIIGLYFATLDYRNDEADYAKFGVWIHWHKTAGFLVFLLLFWRVVHRFRHAVPALPAEMPRWMRLAAQASHFSLYALVFLLGATGLVASDIGNYPVKLFELWYLPQFPPEDRPLADSIFRFHMLLGDIAAFLVPLHVGASLYHHFVLKDNVLARMLNGAPREET